MRIFPLLIILIVLIMMVAFVVDVPLLEPVPSEVAILQCSSPIALLGSLQLYDKHFGAVLAVVPKIRKTRNDVEPPNRNSPGGELIRVTRPESHPVLFI